MKAPSILTILKRRFFLEKEHFSLKKLTPSDDPLSV
jgi:hypothetical protein